MIYFPFSDYWMFYAGFTLFVLMMLALDLGVFHKKAHIVSIKEATTWTIVWVTLAIIFNFLFLADRGECGPHTEPRATAEALLCGGGRPQPEPSKRR
jgi:hypothetical protein